MRNYFQNAIFNSDDVGLNAAVEEMTSNVNETLLKQSSTMEVDDQWGDDSSDNHPSSEKQQIFENLTELWDKNFIYLNCCNILRCTQTKARGV